MDWITDSLYLLLALALLALNGFFVAAEFALVKIRPGQLEELVKRRRPFALAGRWLVRRLDGSLSACQLGITMASLGLGWVGEPAFARLLLPVFRFFGADSEALVHTLAFIVAFTLITVFHLIVGEQAPKIFAIRRPQLMVIWIALPLQVFYVLSFPFLVAINAATAWLLGLVGVKGATGHGVAHSEEELRALLREAHVHGEISRAEHRLLDAVFGLDDTVCSQIMLPRADVVFLDLNRPLEENLQLLQRTEHTRYPVCDGSLDRVRGVLHVKDIVGVSRESIDLEALSRPPQAVPETLPLGRLLRHFQATHQHMAIVVDEHDSLSGIVTLENVLEEIVGSVQDEFDSETPDITPDGRGSFLVRGGTSVERVNATAGLELEADGAETLSGLLTARLGRFVETGDRVELEGAAAEVLETKGARATRIRLVPTKATSDPTPSAEGDVESPDSPND